MPALIAHSGDLVCAQDAILASAMTRPGLTGGVVTSIVAVVFLSLNACWTRYRRSSRPKKDIIERDSSSPKQEANTYFEPILSWTDQDGSCKALSIFEIVDAICELTSNSRSGKTTLAALAQTNTSLRDPALDVLWRKMHSLVPLLKCFPSNLWDISELPPHAFNFTRLMQPADWDRVSLYAPRIKEIDLDDMEVFLGSNFADVLHLALNGRHLLPNLQKMQWQPGSFPFRHCRALLGPVATKIALRMDSPQHVSTLSDLVGRSPQLTELSVVGWGAASFESSFLIHMHHLQRLSMPLFKTHTVHHLATLSDLQSLSLVTRHISPPAEPPRIASAFTSLRKLALQADTAAWSAYIVNMFERCALTNLHLNFNEPEPPAAHAALNSLIKERCVLTALTSFRAWYFDFDQPPPADVTVCAETWCPLYAFNNLRIVVVHASRIDITDADIRELATAWQHLECLTLGSTHNFVPVDLPLLTLESLAILAERCTALVELGLELNACVVPALPTPEVRQSTLKMFHAHRSAIEGWPAVAAYIGRIFPAIRNIEATSLKAGGRRATREGELWHQYWARGEGRSLEDTAMPNDEGL
ncbi:hypothetical protein B0H16DRAFT_1698839 [Mycena metata]|uniref:Uncharacterized protein n=1 Tax=Mycena metata TaxID=1033252 RepID=A0AAD7MMS0_9AGAR|nr:hypothetical protein B0H16DRAFT_1698839 [Mycena metata]